MTVNILQQSPLVAEIPGRVKIPGAWLPCRSVLIEVAPGSLWMWSPVKMTEEDIAQIRELGQVDYIVAPSLMHHLFFPAATRVFPSAQTYGPASLRTKVPTCAFAHDISAESFEKIGIKGYFISGIPTMDEWTLYHEESKTLIFTDLLFNMKGTYEFPLRVMCTFMGTLNKTTVSRLINLVIKDRRKLKESLLPLLDIPATRIIVAHGELMENVDGPRVLADALQSKLS